MAAAIAALTDAAGGVASEARQEDAVLIADAERHMRLAHSWLARLNAASSVVLDTVHASVGPRLFAVWSACVCAVLLDEGTWLVRGEAVTNVLGLPARGRERGCEGDCRERWMVSVQDAGAVVEVFSASDRVHRGVVVRANSDSMDVASRQGVVTLTQSHVSAIHIVD